MPMDLEAEELCYHAGTHSDQQSRVAFLLDHPQLINAGTVAGLVETIRTAVRVNVHRASALADAAIAIAHLLNDDGTLGLALRAKANTCWFKGDCRPAVVLFDHAAELLERAGNLAELGRTLSSSIQSRLLIGEYSSAHEAADKARDIFRTLADYARVARVELNVANILHRQSRYSEALNAYQHAYRELLPYKDAEAIGVALHNIAVCLIALDDYSAAQEVYARVRLLCEQNEMPQLVAQADYNVAYLHFLRGEYLRALELLRTTKDLCEKNGDSYHLGLCDLDASDIYLELNLIHEAADAARSSLEQFKALDMNYEAVRSQLNLAVATSLQGNAKRSLELFQSAEEMARHEDNEVLPAFIHLYCSAALLELGRLEEAKQLCLRALRVFQKAGLPGKHVAARLLLGRIFVGSSELTEAARECGSALKLLQELDAPVLLYQAEFLNGQIFELSGDQDEAYRCYQRARSSLETVRSSLQGDELKIGFMRRRLGVYNRLIQVCLNRNADEDSDAEAFYYVEAAKSRTLQDLILASPQPKRASPEENGTDGAVQDLRRVLNWYYRLIEREHFSPDQISQDRVSHLRKKALSIESELCRSLLDAQISGSVGSALERSQTAGLPEIRRALGNEATLLEYFAIEDQVYAIVVSSTRFTILPLASAAEIGRDLRMLQFQLSKFRLDPAYVERFEKVLIASTQGHLRRLFRRLIEPIEDSLTTPSLAIVPYGPLHSLPFHALFDGTNYLADRFRITHAPSASILAHAHRMQPEGNDLVSLVLGIQDDRLPSVREEVEAATAALPNAKLLWDHEATEAALRKYGAASRVIHIATHGYFRPDNPMFSAIRLADGYLTLHDLYRMNLPANFLALSGCVTGLNVVEEGDELIGLSRGLLYAGAHSLLLSLWEVDDRSTCEFMKSFYAHFDISKPKADAVRSAMLQIREWRPHPYYWGAFKLIGRGF